jgi:hypothetical protein
MALPSNPKALPQRLKLPIIPQRPPAPLSPDLTSLPNSVLNRIYAFIDHPRTQIAFSLSCRTLASIAGASAIPLKGGLIKISSGGGKQVEYDKEYLLADLVKWKFIDIYSGTNKSQMQLCIRCWKYLPLHRVWKLPSGQPISTLKHVDWIHAVMLWTLGPEDADASKLHKQSTEAEEDGKAMKLPTDQANLLEDPRASSPPTDQVQARPTTLKRKRDDSTVHSHNETHADINTSNKPQKSLVITLRYRSRPKLKPRRRICPSCHCQFPPELGLSLPSSPANTSSTATSPISSNFTSSSAASSRPTTSSTPSTPPQYFLQAWPSGFAGGMLRVQSYEDVKREREVYEALKKGRKGDFRWFGRVEKEVEGEELGELGLGVRMKDGGWSGKGDVGP